MKPRTGKIERTSRRLSTLRVLCILINFSIKVEHGHAFNQFQSCSDEQWSVFEDRIYRVETSLRTYTTARAVCQTYGGDLAVVPTKAIEEFVLDILPDGCSGSTTAYWIGLDEISTQGVFEWVDGTHFNSSILNWGLSEPDSNQDCVFVGRSTSLSYDRFWYDYPCTTQFRSVCSKQFVLPQLQSAPREENVGSKHVVISWQAWQATDGIGLGPVRAYKIYTRTTEDGALFKNVGYVVNADAKGDIFSFNLTYLEPSTEMEIAIAAIDLCSGMEGELSPALSITTAGKSLDNTLLMTQASPMGSTGSGGSNSTVPWALFSIFGVVGNIIIWGFLIYTCTKLRSGDQLMNLKRTEPGSSPNSAPMPDSLMPTHSYDSAVFKHDTKFN